MLHVIEIVPPKEKLGHPDQWGPKGCDPYIPGRPYIAGVTSSFYLAKLVKAELARQVPKLKVTIRDMPDKWVYPLVIYEHKHKFSYYPESQRLKILQKKKGTVYYLTADWWPEQIGSDRMGRLDHEHLEMEHEIEIEAFNKTKKRRGK
jgi:hypothetical protein